ncbi:unnamed protein product [Angiostrongylus costaricensis]|uniref:Reverse transcriptase domain-containing protein n=1 Tax=Angiostrongylus costaricensis TaxID=334426 RepID=A0A0R3PTJ1_ANGCS|nr:unnamed protein product [Angiostrongylus costaricensis]
MGVKIDRQLHHLRFTDDIVLITLNISQGERMLDDFDKACGKIGLRLSLTKTMFMKNGLVSYDPFTLNGTSIFSCSSYVYLGQEIKMINGLAAELCRRKRAAWVPFKSIGNAVKSTKNTRLLAHLFYLTVLPALSFASETWCRCASGMKGPLSVIERAVERTVLGVNRFRQVRDGIRSSDLRQRSKNRDTVLYAKQSKIRWDSHVMRMNENRWIGAVSEWVPCDFKRTSGRPPTRWSEF